MFFCHIHIPAYIPRKCLILKWCAVDLDDTVILLEELLSLGKTVFLDPFNVEAQGPCNTHTLQGGNYFMEVNTYMITCQRLTLCTSMSQHWHLPLLMKVRLITSGGGGGRRACSCMYTLCAHPCECVLTVHWERSNREPHGYPGVPSHLETPLSLSRYCQHNIHTCWKQRWASFKYYATVKTGNLVYIVAHTHTHTPSSSISELFEICLHFLQATEIGIQISLQSVLPNIRQMFMCVRLSERMRHKWVISSSFIYLPLKHPIKSVDKRI